MIRHPINSAVGRTRPDINRVAEGIAASLRQFSISAQRCTPDQNDDGNSNSDKLTGRQRGVAAVRELIMTAEATVADVRDQRPGPRIIREPSIRQPLGLGRGSSSNVITTPPGFRGVQRVGFGPGWKQAPGEGENTIQRAPGPNIIRGGFRGRGDRGGPSFGRGGFGGEGGGSWPRRPGGRDDRPRRGRGRRGSADGRQGGRRGRGQDQDEEEDIDLIGSSDEVKAYLEPKEIGETISFNPQLSLESLAGWGPGLATSATPFGQSEAVLRQARILGGGNNFHPQHLVDPIILRERYANGTGMFVPPSDDARLWASQIFRNKEVVDGVRVSTEKKIEAPPEVKTAVLEDAVLGRYDGPKYAEDALGTLASYVKRDATWNAAAGRGIEAKVRSLLGQPAKSTGESAEEAKA